MPLFFAYFRVLLNAVELRQAHWFWLTDLSSPDPLHILPILIIITMFLTQYITPSPGMDPAQRKMMAFMMPIIFGFMLWHFASGLALYWGTGNVINLAIQLGINQSSMGKEMHEIAANTGSIFSSAPGPFPKTTPNRKCTTRIPASTAGCAAASHCLQTSARNPSPAAESSSSTASPRSP
jgi:YidC/Oxa1 family membrane protein insertase